MADTATATTPATHDPMATATIHSPKLKTEGKTEHEDKPHPPSPTTDPATKTEPPALPPPPPPPTPQTDTPRLARLARLPRPKTHELKAKLRNTTQRDDISAQEALRRQLNNERNRRTRQRKIEREIASGVRHKDGRVRRSTERPWC
ncbi:hypothetical protein P167DRAFT_569176 [Morchella conica CCBAS932]|uniref:Uncharacterized protein n=1 Tax=Morchella conica CCBAS932 TaxID=1392247 RepID=A0A3N4KKP9_9PEZI|nr:hypothetical protein P167DRAFT_569176 [Morchella conica CCBAS932]